jgi:flavodoxin
MKTAVIYATRSGNTKRVAEQIAEALRERGTAELYEAAAAPADLHDFDLVVIGGPTEAHGMTPPIKDYLARLVEGSVRSHVAAAFDTRLAWPRALSGSAAEGIATDLRAKGALVATAPESFIVSRKPELKEGELERAGRWARGLAQSVSPRTTAGVTA